MSRKPWTHTRVFKPPLHPQQTTSSGPLRVVPRAPDHDTDARRLLRPLLDPGALPCLSSGSTSSVRTGQSPALRKTEIDAVFSSVPCASAAERTRVLPFTSEDTEARSLSNIFEFPQQETKVSTDAFCLQSKTLHHRGHVPPIHTCRVCGGRRWSEAVGKLLSEKKNNFCGLLHPGMQ